MSSIKDQQLKRHAITVVIAATIILGIIIVLAIGLRQPSSEIPSVLIGKEAKPFQGLWLQGQDFVKGSEGPRLRLADLRGKPVILNFWASWCYSCRAEAHDLEKVWQKLRGEGVMVVGVAIHDTKEAALGFAKQYGKTYPLALDDQGSVALDYGVTGVPETFFIDRGGKIVDKVAAPLTAEELLARVKKIL